MDIRRKRKTATLPEQLTTRQTVEEAFATLLQQNYHALITWEAVAIKGEDVEGVHQMRVALRRMRSALSLFRKAIPSSVTAPMGNEMRWAANTVGPARDRDVFIQETLHPMAGQIPLAEGEEIITALANQYRDEAYLDVRELLASERYQQFKHQFGQWILQRGWRQGDWGTVSTTGLEDNIVSFAHKVLDKRRKQTIASGADIAAMSPEERHLLRIACKKLRYATEFFLPLFDPKTMNTFTLALKKLQDILGMQNDVAVLPGLLEALLARDDSRPMLQYAGAIMGWRALQAREAESQLQAAWQAFVQSRRPTAGHNIHHVTHK